MKEKDKKKDQLANESVRIRQQNKKSKVSATKLKRKKEQLQISEKKYKDLVEILPIGIAISTPGAQGRVIEANPALWQMFGYDSREEFLKVPASAHYYDSKERKRFAELRQKGLVKDYETKFKRKDGTTIWGSVTSMPRMSEGKKIEFVNVVEDITQRKKMEERLLRLYSRQVILRNINEMLLKAESEREIYRQVPSLLKELEFIEKFVWIGLIEKGNFEVKPIVRPGIEKDYLSSIRITWDNSKYGKGPTGTAIKTGRPCVIEDIKNDPRYEAWRNEVLKSKYSSSIAVPLKQNREILGVLNVYSDKKEAFGDEEVEFLKQVSGDITIGIKNIRLKEELVQSLKNIRRLFEQGIEAIASLSESRDPYTAGHQRRVTQLSCAIAKEMGFSEKQIEGIHASGLLHDIGKIYIPTDILNRPGRLSNIEIDLIRTHPKVGYDILKRVNFPWPVAQIVLQHHERQDGSGYPQGLSNEENLIEARILAVADVVEAMSSHRPYRPALGIDAALEEISKNSGIFYDHKVVDVCLKLFKEKNFKFEKDNEKKILKF
jgi:PAS domain S-box-containing protein/putative nucleotidyltransferase with HDIG domain